MNQNTQNLYHFFALQHFLNIHNFSLFVQHIAPYFELLLFCLLQIQSFLLRFVLFPQLYQFFPEEVGVILSLIVPGRYILHLLLDFRLQREGVVWEINLNSPDNGLNFRGINLRRLDYLLNARLLQLNFGIGELEQTAFINHEFILILLFLSGVNYRQGEPPIPPLFILDINVLFFLATRYCVKIVN